MKHAVFFDRDGVINELVYDRKHGNVDSPMEPSQVALMYGIVKLIKGVREMGFTTIICSNQPSVGLGKMTLRNFKAVDKNIDLLLKIKGELLNHKYFCLHHPFAKIKKYKVKCDCRKPKAGLFLMASKELNVDLSKSWMIGDGVDDVLSGEKAGCRTILLANIKSTETLRIIEEQLGDVRPDYIIKKLPEALEIIKKNS